MVEGEDDPQVAAQGDRTQGGLVRSAGCGASAPRGSDAVERAPRLRDIRISTVRPRWRRHENTAAPAGPYRASTRSRLRRDIPRIRRALSTLLRRIRNSRLHVAELVASSTSTAMAYNATSRGDHCTGFSQLIAMGARAHQLLSMSTAMSMVGGHRGRFRTVLDPAPRRCMADQRLCQRSTSVAAIAPSRERPI